MKMFLKILQSYINITLKKLTFTVYSNHFTAVERNLNLFISMERVEFLVEGFDLKVERFSG